MTENSVFASFVFSQNDLPYKEKSPQTNMPFFSTKTPTLFCVKSKCYEKSLTLFSGQPFFYQTLSVHVYYISENCAKNFELNMKEFHSQISNLMRKFDIVGKKAQNCALELENAVRTHVVRSQIKFLSKSKKIWKNIFFDNLVSRQTDPSIIECSFDKFA